MKKFVISFFTIGLLLLGLQPSKATLTTTGAGSPVAAAYVGPNDAGAGNGTMATWGSCSSAITLAYAVAAGQACLIQRASDNLQCEIKFNSTGYIDESTMYCLTNTVNILTFCNGTTCKAMTGTDQAGGGNVWTAANFATAPVWQPAVASANGKAGLLCSSAAATQLSATVAFQIFTPLTLVVEAERTGNFDNFTSPFSGDAGNAQFTFHDVPNRASFLADGEIVNDSVADNQVHSFIGINTSGAGSVFAVDGDYTAPDTLGGTQILSTLIVCGDGSYDGYVFEWGTAASGVAISTTTTGPALSLNMDTRYVLSNPYELMHYTCNGQVYWVQHAGSNSNDGLTFATGWATPDAFFAHGIVAHNTCINVEAGHTYATNILFPAISGGSIDTTGWIVFRSTDSDGNLVPEVVNSTPTGLGATLTGTTDDNTNKSTIGSSISDGTTVFNFAIFDGFNVTTKNGSASAFVQSCINFSGVGTPWVNGGNYGPQDIVIQNTYVHDCSGAGIAFAASDGIRFINDVVFVTSWQEVFNQSNMTWYGLRHQWNHPLSKRQQALAYRNVIAHTVSAGATSYLIDPGASFGRSDEEGFICDDGINGQGHGAGPNANSAGPYQYSVGIIGSIFYQNNGQGVQINNCSHVTVAWNTFYLNGQDPADPGTLKASLCMCGGNNNDVENNIIANYGGSTIATVALAAPSTTIHVDNVVPWQYAVINNGDFTYQFVVPDSTNPLHTFIGPTDYEIIGTTKDTTNVSTIPGGWSGTLVSSTMITVADGGLFNAVVPYQQNTVSEGCNGSGVPARMCSWLGYTLALVFAPQRGILNTTCAPGGTPGTCTEITVDMSDSQSVAKNNLVYQTNGGGSFLGLNIAIGNAFGSLATFVGNIVQDPDITTITWPMTDRAIAHSSPFGPGWGPTTTLPPPDFHLLPASSGIYAALPIQVKDINGNAQASLWCPPADLFGNANEGNCGHQDIGAVKFLGTQLTYQGPGDVNPATWQLDYSNVAFNKTQASGRFYAMIIACNGVATTLQPIHIATNAQLADSEIESFCSGWEAGSSTVSMFKWMEKANGGADPQCAAQAVGPIADWPTVKFNNTGGKTTIQTSGAGPTVLTITVGAFDQYCGNIFSGTGAAIVAERTFGSTTSALLDFANGSEQIGFGTTGTAYLSAGAATATGAYTESTYALLGAAPNCVAGSPTTQGHLSVGDPATSWNPANFDPSFIQTQITIGGQNAGSGNNFTGFIASVDIAANLPGPPFFTFTGLCPSQTQFETFHILVKSLYNLPL